MKYLFLFVLTLSILTSGCKSEDATLDNILEADKALVINEAGVSKAVEDFPGKIPGNHKVLQMGMQPAVYGWKDFADYLQFKIDNERNEHYYDNLEWLTISYILDNDKFYEEASHEIKEMIWKKMEARKFINNPGNAFKLIITIENLSEKEKANRLRLVEIKNKDNFKNSPDLLNAHLEKYKKTYSQMSYLTYDRWGKPLFDVK